VSYYCEDVSFAWEEHCRWESDETERRRWWWRSWKEVDTESCSSMEDSAVAVPVVAVERLLPA